jgi:hypothetical protein
MKVAELVTVSPGKLIPCLVLATLWLAVCLPRLPGPIDLRWDASTYYVLGSALAQGKGYRLLNEPGEIQAIQYPPLLPFVVALHQRVLRSSAYLTVTPWLRLSYFALAGAYLAATYSLARHFLSRLEALLACALVVFSFDSYLHPSDTLYAELPFAATSTLFLIGQRRPGRLWTCATGLLAVAAYFLRTAGIVLLAAWVIESLIERRWGKAVARAAIGVIPVLLWQSHVGRVQSSEAYRRPAYSYQRAPYYYANVSYGENSRLVDPFRPELGTLSPRDLPARVLRNLLDVPAAIAETICVDSKSPNWLEKPLRVRLGVELPSRRTFERCLVLLGSAVILGGAALAATGEWRLPLYFAMTTALIVLTPWPEQFWRYFAAVAPLSAIFFMGLLRRIGNAVAAIGSAWAHRLAPAVVAAPLSAMLLLQAAIAERFLQNRLPVSYYDDQGHELQSRLLSYERPWHELDSAFEWLRQHAAKDDVLATTIPHLAYLRSNHRAVLFPLESDPATVRRLLDEVPVRYVVLDALKKPGLSERYAAPAVDDRPAEWRLAFSTPGGTTRVFERLGGAPDTPVRGTR